MWLFRKLRNLAKTGNKSQSAHSSEASTESFPAITYNNQTILTADDLEKIKTYITEKTKAGTVINKNIELENDFRIDYNYLTDIEKEKLNTVTNQSTRFEKNEQLPRTVDYIKASGKIIVHTNQKFSTDLYNAHNNENAKKNEIAVLGEGSYAIVKLCFDCTDDKPKPMARLQIDFDKLKGLLAQIKQVEFSNKYTSEFIEKRFCGSVYQHKEDKYGIYVYAEQALCDLNHLYENLTDAERTEFDNESNQGLIPTIYQRLILNVLHGLKEIHAAGDVHRDIKGANILVYRNDIGELSAKISDFGLTTSNKKDVPLATTAYASPQVFKGHSGNDRAGYKKFFFSKELDNRAFYGKTKYKEITENSEKIFANSKDDMFALGIMICEHLTKSAAYDNIRNQTNLTDKIEKICADHPFVALLLETQETPRASAKIAEHYLKIMLLLSEQEKKADNANNNELDTGIKQIADHSRVIPNSKMYDNLKLLYIKLLKQYLQQNDSSANPELYKYVESSLDGLKSSSRTAKP